MATPSVTQKYRPSVATVLIAVNLMILVLPLGSVIFFRIYEGRLVHETEAELISQAAVIAAAYKQALRRRLSDPDDYGVELKGAAVADVGATYSPVVPQIDLARHDTLAPRPAARQADAPAGLPTIEAGLDVTQLFFDARRTTLAGMVLVVTGGGESSPR